MPSVNRKFKYVTLQMNYKQITQKQARKARRYDGNLQSETMNDSLTHSATD